MSERLRQTKRHLGIISLLGVFIVLASAGSLLIPLGEAPDEVSHYSYVDTLIRTRQLPQAQGYVLGEAHQPPLYYAIAALATGWIPREDLIIIANPDLTLNDPATPNLLLHPRSESFPYQGQALAWHLVRLLSVLMGAITIWATWKTMLLLSNHNPIALGTAALVAFLPEFTFISSVVNNDNLITTLSALTILQSVRIVRGDRDTRAFVWLGLLLGAAALSKLSGLTLWLFAGCLFAWLFWRAPGRRKIILDAAVTFGLALLLGGPLFLYNQITRGDPLGWSLILQVTQVRTAPMTLDAWLKIAGGLYTSFFGRYGGALQLELPPWLYGAMSVLVLVALLGWLLHARDAIRGKSEPNIRTLLVLFVLFWGLMLAAYIRWTLAVLGTDQARQLFPGIPLLAGVLTTGWARVFKSNLTIGVALWGLGWLGTVILFLSLMFTTFYAHPLPATALDLASDIDAHDFGAQIQLVNYRIAPATLHPGEMLTFDALWHTRTTPRADYWFYLVLMQDGESVAHKDGVPGGGRITTDLWQPGESYRALHALTVPVDAEPGVYQVVLGIRAFGESNWLLSAGKNDIVLGTITILP